MYASVLVPLFMYVVFEMTQMQYVKEKMQFSTQQAVRAATWELDDFKLADGKLVLDADKAELKLRGILNENFAQLSNGLAGDPSIEVEIVDDIEEGTLQNVELITGDTISTNRPYVKVHVDYRIDGIISKKFFAQEIEEVYALDFKVAEDLSGTQKLQLANNGADTSIVWTNIVNPYLAYEDLKFPISTTAGKVELLGGTNNHIHVDLPINYGVYRVTFDNGVRDVINGVLGDTNAFEISIPTRMPKGTNVYLQLDLQGDSDFDKLKHCKLITDTRDFSLLNCFKDVHLSSDKSEKISTMYDRPTIIGTVNADIGEVTMIQDIKMKEVVEK